MPKDYTLNESKLASYANSAVECGAMSEPIHSLICDVIEDGREYRRQIKYLRAEISKYQPPTESMRGTAES